MSKHVFVGEGTQAGVSDPLWWSRRRGNSPHLPPTVVGGNTFNHHPIPGPAPEGRVEVRDRSPTKLEESRPTETFRQTASPTRRGHGWGEVRQQCNPVQEYLFGVGGSDGTGTGLRHAVSLPKFDTEF